VGDSFVELSVRGHPWVFYLRNMEFVETKDGLDSAEPQVHEVRKFPANLSKTGNNHNKSQYKMPKWLALEELERDRARVCMNKDRVKTITQKLSKLQQGLEVDRTRSRTAFEAQFREVEKKISKLESEQESRLEECDQQIEHVMEALGQERLARELLDERKTKEAEVIVKTVDLKLEDLRKVTNKLEQQQSTELRYIQEQLENEKVLRAQAEEKFGVQLYEQVSRLTEQVNTYQKQNAKLVERVNQLEENAKKTEKSIVEEQTAHKELESHVVSMLEDLCNKMRTEIVAERNDREAMEETLLKLIEETCSRVEGGLVSSSP